MNTTAAWYKDYYAKRGASRNDILANAGVLFQDLAGHMALMRALARIGYDPQSAKVLDVGGGSGGSLLPFMTLRTAASQLACVDIQEDRIKEGPIRFPGVDFQLADARRLPYETASFDVVFASTMFVQLTDDAVALAIASEMRRVCKHGGHIIVRDWALTRPGDRTMKAVSKSRIRTLFGRDAAYWERGALPPPVGRTLSRFAPWAYFVVHAIMPWGMRVYVLPQ